MSKARLVITAVTVERRPVSEVAATYGVARSWVYALLARYRAEGEAAFQPRSRRPKTSPAALSDEVVMICGHLDSWHTGVGATDNADGSTTVMEAMRILKAIGARPRRTIRVALWGGEEQGLLGSKAWVTQHLAGPANAAARDKFDVYYNIDNGTGKIYGWFLQNQEEVRPIFDSCMSAPGS